MAQSFQSWWESLMPITKFTLCMCLFLSISVALGVFSPVQFLMSWELVWYRFEVWRLVTSLFFLGPPGLPFMFNLYFFVTYQRRLEEEAAPQGFLGNVADHVWMMVIIGGSLLGIGHGLMGMKLVSVSFTLSILWVWCKRHEEVELSFYGFTFKAAYFPWILAAIHMLMGSNLVDDVLGIVCGHIYVFFKDILPDTHGVHLAETPQFMKKLIPPRRVAMAGVGGFQRFAPAQPAPAGGNAPRWPGGGRRLGDE